MHANEKAFVDTNVFIYLYSGTEIEKQKTAQGIIENFNCVISTQVLNEFSNVCIKKFNTNSDEVLASIKEIIEASTVLYIETEDILQAILLQKKYGYGYWDCLMLVSALKSECKYILTEDMRNGQLIEGKLVIKNIFP